jgi:hypothetical protein
MCVVAAGTSLLLAGVTAAASGPTGSLTQLPGKRGCLAGGAQPACTPAHDLVGAGLMVASPDGRNVYVGGGVTNVLRRNPADGTLSELPGEDGCLAGLGYRYLKGCRQLSSEVYVGAVTSLSGNGKTAYMAGGKLSGGESFSPLMVGFDRTPATGALRQFAARAACIEAEPGKCISGKNLGGGPTLVSHDGKNVYASLGGGIWAFRRDVQTGALTQIPGPAGCIVTPGFLQNLRNPPHCVTARTLKGTGVPVESPDGRNVYALSNGDNAVDVLRRNPQDGTLEQLPGRGGCVASTGLGGACANGRGLFSPRTLAVSSDGRNVYVVSSRVVTAASPKSHALSVYRRDPRTGALTQLPGKAGCVSHSGTGGACAKGVGLFGAESVAVSSDGRSVYVAASFEQGVAIFRRDPRTGAVEQLPGTAGCADSKGRSWSGAVCMKARIAIAEEVAVSPDGRNVYVGSDDNSGPAGAVAGQIAVLRSAR